MLPYAVTGNGCGADWAVFLDVDGTLLEIAETPQSVRVPERLKQLLVDLSLHLDGALALISGRSLVDLDRLFAPLHFCAAGVHGCERREATGCIVRPPIDPHLLDIPRRELAKFVDRHEGLLLEDKGYGLAVHFRRAPMLSAEVAHVVRAACRQVAPEFSMQTGKCVFEIRPAGWTKGSSIATFMQSMPFLNRTPVFIGDDVTDEDGFSVVNGLGGISIKVGDMEMTTRARFRLAGVDQVLSWLEYFSPATFADVLS